MSDRYDFDLEPERRFEVLSRPQCLDYLRAGSIGRVAWNTDNGPQILPVTYALQGDAIMFLTERAGPLAALASDQRVAFEVDDFDVQRRNAWSVCVSGRSSAARHSEGGASGAFEQDPVPWVTGERDLSIAISLDEVTGRLLLARG